MTEASPPDSGLPALAGAQPTAGEVVQRLFGRDTLYLLLWAVQLLGAAALTPVISRVLSVGAFGQVAAANAVMQVLFVLTGLGLASALQRTFAQPGQGPQAALGLVALLVGTAAGLTWLADLTGPAWAPSLGFHGYPVALHVAVLWGGTSSATNGCLALLRSQDRLKAFASVSLVQSVIAEALSVGLVLLGPATAARFLAGQLLAQVAALVLGLILLRPRRAALRPGRAALGRALAYGLPFVPATLATFVLNAADRLIVQHQLGQVAVARYQIAYNVGAMPMLLLGVLNSSWLPRLFAVQDPATRGAVLASSRDALYRLLCPVLLGMSLGAPLVLRLWAPSAFRPDGLQLVTTIVIVTAVPYTAGLALSRTLLTSGRSRPVAAATVVAAFANVGFNLLLVPAWGLRGSAAATLAAYGLLHAMLRYAVPRSGEVPPPHRGRLVELALCSAVALLIAVAAPITMAALVVRTTAAAGCLVWLVLEGWRLAGRGTRVRS